MFKMATAVGRNLTLQTKAKMIVNRNQVICMVLRQRTELVYGGRVCCLCTPLLCHCLLCNFYSTFLVQVSFNLVTYFWLLLVGSHFYEMALVFLCLIWCYYHRPAVHWSIPVTPFSYGIWSVNEFERAALNFTCCGIPGSSGISIRNLSSSLLKTFDGNLFILRR